MDNNKISSGINKYTFYVNGMHCASCTNLIEGEISRLKDVKKVSVYLSENKMDVEGDFGGKTQEDIADEFSNYLKQYGYSISQKREIKKIDWREFFFSLLVAIVLIFGFFTLQKSDIINVLGDGGINYFTAILIGIVASLSTCLAVLGGLILSISANYAKSASNWKSHVFLHIGRLSGFFVLGGVIGAIGASFQLSISASAILTALAGIIMIILGINLLDLFSRKISIAFPKSFSVLLLKNRFGSAFAPFLFGIGTFFIPCGFTQSMQFYTLGTGNFLSGGLTMFFFALGTFPVLALLSFGAFTIQEGRGKRIFLKTAGMIVVFLGIISIMNSLAVIGLIKPIL